MLRWKMLRPHDHGLVQGFHDDTGFHHPGDVLHHRYILQRIRGHGDQISKLTRLKGAEILIERQKLRAVDGCSL